MGTTSKDGEKIDKALAEMCEGDEVSVTFGEETFSPVQYNSFRIGPFFYKTRVHKGETPEQAFDRANAYVTRMAQRAFKEKMETYFGHLREAGKAANPKG